MRKQGETGIHVLVSAGRGPMIEFMPDPDAEKLAEQIVAFANSVGGTIVVGMDEHGRVHPDVSEYLEPILDRAVQMCFPRFRAAELLRSHAEQMEDGQITTVTVEHARYRLSVEGKGVFVRSGRMNVWLSPEQVAKEDYPVYRMGFEDKPMDGAKQEDLDEALIEEYQRKRMDRGPRGESLTRMELLRDTGAVDVQGTPTAVGLLLFGRYPQRFLPHARVVLVRYKGTSIHQVVASSERYTRRVDIEGPLARQVERAWEVLIEEIHHESQVKGLERRERYDYPTGAVREALVNAIAHRDYSVAGQYVEIRMFDDRMEIMSPGGLPGHITVENIRDEHYSRNPRLVRGLYYWGYIEELGQGIDIIYELMNRDHHPAPEFRDTVRNFTLTLYNRVDPVMEEFGAQINPRQIRALRFLGENERITNSQYRQLCPDVTPETLRLDLRDLVEKGVLLKIGDKKGTYYVRK